MDKTQEFNLEMRLLRGDIVQFERLKIKPLTLGEIEEMGVSEYLGLINFTTLTKDKIVGRKLKDTFKDFSFFDIIINYDELRKLFLRFLTVFVLHDEEEESIRYEQTIDSVVIVYNGEIGRIDYSNFEKFLEFMRYVYHMKIAQKESEREDIDDEMADLLREFEEVEDKISKDKGNEITLASMVEAVCVKHPSLNLYNIWDYNMYQFMKTYYRIEQIDTAKNIFTGIYSGRIESKKIDLKEYHWAKKID